MVGYSSIIQLFRKGETLHADHRAVRFLGFRVGEAVAEPDAQLLHSFDATNTGSQIGAEKTAVGCFVGKPAHGAKTQIDGSGGELTGFEMRAITQDHDPVEGQARFRAVPVNELIDGVTITPLCVC